MPQSTLISADELHDRLVRELDIADLSVEEQNLIISGLSQSLLERITFVVMGKMPESEFEKIDQLIEAGENETVQAMVQKFVPDVSSLIDQIIADGIAEYKALVDKNMASASMGAQTSQTAEEMRDQSL